ncbi:MAG: class I SAM-dependent methyltransferase [Candidatus Dormibacteraeota bacterium]|nr:class I SAM-dependent methyltransferase [Candidatus Dormibacteraeota bacterium]
MSDRDRLDPVRAYYEARGDSEWHRLDNPYEGAIERELHRRAFERLLPSRARVLDLGGGPGHWTIWLARRGHRVVLADLSPRLLAIARRELTEAGVEPEAVLEVDARDLGRFAAGEFDAVLALGPFYHLVSVADRGLAAREAHRVLRPGGLLLATVMTRYAWLLGVLLEAGSSRLADVRRALEDGVYRNPVEGRFTEAYLFRPAEVVPFFETNGFETELAMASQSFLYLAQEQVAELHQRDAEAYAALLDIAYQAATDPSILGISGHILYAGRTRAGTD